MGWGWVRFDIHLKGGIRVRIRLGLGLQLGLVDKSPETWIDPINPGFWGYAYPPLGEVSGSGLVLGFGRREGWVDTFTESWSDS